MPSTVEPPMVAIQATDPLSAVGVQAQLERSGLQVTALDDPATTVAVAVADHLDRDTISRLRTLHRSRGLPVVLVVPEVTASVMAGVAQIGAFAVLSRAQTTTERLGVAARDATRIAAAFGSERTWPVSPEATWPAPPELTPIEPARRTSNGLGSRSGGLSTRERRVMVLLADGLSTQEVAVQMSYSERTIKNILQDVSSRLKLRNRTHLVAHAIRSGWI